MLLRHLARAARSARALVLVTFRDTEVEMPETLSETLADLRRSEEAVRIRLGGLTEQEVTEFVTRASEGELGGELPELAAAISELTGGNAFLVCELWRALVETGVIEMVDGSLRVTRPLAELGHARERPRGSQPTPRAPVSEDDRVAGAGGDGRHRIRARASAPGERSHRGGARRRARRGRAQRARRGAVRAPSRVPVHPRARAPRGLRPPDGGAGEPSCHLRSARPAKRPTGALPRALADLAYHFTAAAPLGATERAIEYNRLAAAAATGGVRVRRGRELPAQRR